MLSTLHRSHTLPPHSRVVLSVHKQQDCPKCHVKEYDGLLYQNYLYPDMQLVALL